MHRIERIVVHVVLLALVVVLLAGVLLACMLLVMKIAVAPVMPELVVVMVRGADK